jgi:hypothetical protein
MKQKISSRSISYGTLIAADSREGRRVGGTENSRKFLLVILMVMFSFSKCKKDTTSITVKIFFDHIKNGEYDQAKALYSKKFHDPNDEQIKLNLERTHDFLVKYGLPPENKWEIQYDTTSRIIKTKKYIVTINDKYDIDNNVSNISAEIYFEKSMPDSIFIYNIIVSHGHK